MELVSREGYRLDGRTHTDLRAITINHKIINNINVLEYKQGETWVIVSHITEFSKLQRKGKKDDKLQIEMKLRETSFSDTKKGDALVEEISDILQTGFKQIILCKDKVRIDIEILQDDGSLLSVLFNSISVLLCISGVPMVDLILSVSVKFYRSWNAKKNHILSDVSRIEESGRNCFILAYEVKREKIVYMSFGKIDCDQIQAIYDVGIESIKKIHNFISDYLKKGKNVRYFLEN